MAKSTVVRGYTEPRNMPTSNRREMKAKLSAEKVLIQNERIKRIHEQHPLTKKPVSRSKRIALNLSQKPRGAGMPAVNQHRRTEKGMIAALHLKTRKQLRKYRKQQTKLKMAEA